MALNQGAPLHGVKCSGSAFGETCFYGVGELGVLDSAPLSGSRAVELAAWAGTWVCWGGGAGEPAALPCGG